MTKRSSSPVRKPKGNPRGGATQKSSRAKTQKGSSRPTSRGVSKTLYKDNSSQCTYITTRNTRCKKPKTHNKEYCGYHLKIPQHGGHVNTPSKHVKVHEYDYYKEEPDEFDSTASHVASDVWIGSIDSANDAEFLKRHGIKTVMNTSGMEPCARTQDLYKQLGIKYYTLSTSEYNPRTHKYKVVKFLSDEPFRRGFGARDFYKYLHRGCQCLRNAPKPMLVHCHAGVNRSGSLIAAHLMTKPRPYSYGRVVDLLEKANKRRGLHVLTNKDFKTSLKYYPMFGGKDLKGINERQIAVYDSYMKKYG